MIILSWLQDIRTLNSVAVTAETAKCFTLSTKMAGAFIMAGYRTLSLYSAEGRLVARQRPAAGDTSAAFTGLPRGTYIYFFTAGGETKASGKVLVE